jgi:hypothetical protein
MLKWGFLRETEEKAIQAGIDKDTGLHRTGLETYLAVIFPEIKDWIHDKIIEGAQSRCRPDYRSDTLKLIIEFDGIQHYTKPDIIEKDIRNQTMYEELGYKVVRIPYFIQLSNSAVKQLFNRDVKESLFDEQYSSLGTGSGAPAYLCPAGLERMAKVFKQFPTQYKVNLEFLKKLNNEFLTGASFLEKAYNDLP